MGPQIDGSLLRRRTDTENRPPISIVRIATLTTKTELGSGRGRNHESMIEDCLKQNLWAVYTDGFRTHKHWKLSAKLANATNRTDEPRFTSLGRLKE